MLESQPAFGPQGRIKTLEVVARGETLTIQPQRSFGSDLEHEGSWAGAIIAACPGPFKEVVIDLVRYPVVSSWFFAGAMHLLEFYKQSGVTHISLTHASDRVQRTIEMMNMGSLFELLEDAP